jgi:uncharacterized membrane protein
MPVQALGVALRWLGFGLCHQLPERSFFGGGVQVPVCARDTGIYLGILISLALISVLHRGSRPRRMPTLVGWIAIGLMIGAMGLDGVTEYGGLRPTTNELRLITGLLAGFAIGAVVAPMINEEIWRTSSNERVLDTPRRLALWLAAVPVSYVVVYWVLPRLGILYPVLVAGGILATLVAVNLVLVGVLPPFERRADSLLQAWPALSASLALSLVEILVAGLLRVALNLLVLRLAS